MKQKDRNNKHDELQQFKAAMGCGFKPKVAQKMEIIHQDLDRDERYQPDAFCLNLWDYCMPKWLGEHLRDELVDALRGYSEDMALEIADNIINCWSGWGLYATGIQHIDDLLWRLYGKILDRAHMMGIKLEYRL